MYLRRLFRIKCEEDPTKINPFDGDLAFHSLPLRTKVEILHDICDFRLDNEDVPGLLKTLEASCLRVEPLGQDSGGSNYFYFFGTRLYREDYSTTNHGQPVKRRGRKGTKSQGQLVVTKWQVACSTEEDWQVLTDKFKNCKNPHERSLHRTLRDNFLPELPRLFAEKEKLQRKRMLEHLGRNGRSSEEDSGVVNIIGSATFNGLPNSATSVGCGKPTNRISLPKPENIVSGESAFSRCGDYDDESWSSQQEEEDDNSYFNITTDMDDEQELRKLREEQEKADRLLAEAIEREERKARLHLRERRGGGAFSSPSNTGSRNSSSVSTERTQSLSKASTVSKQTVAAAVSKKGSKTSPVKSSPVKKKSKGGSGNKSKRKSHNGKKKAGNSGRMTNNSMSVSLSPVADDDESELEKKEVEDDKEDGDDSSPPPISYSDEEDFERDKSLIFKRFETGKLEFEKSPSKKGSSKKKKIIPRSPSPEESTLGGKKKSQKSRPKQKIIMQINEDDDDDEDEEEAGENLEAPGQADNEEFCEEEEEADYESIVARTLHNNNNDGSKGKVKVKSDKKEKPSKGKEKAKKDKARTSSEGKKPKEKGGSSSGNKKRKRDKSSPFGGGKNEKSTKNLNKSESISSGLIGPSTISLGGGTSKTKVKSSVLFSQSEEDVQIGMHKVIEAIKNHRDAWPFVNPVDEDYAPNYYKIIGNPMDLQTMEDKLDNHEYSSLDEFKSDFERIVENCRTYNGPVSEYTEMVETVEGAFNKLIQRYITPDESDEEISIEYANTTTTSSDRKRPSHSHSSESSVPKKKKKSKLVSERTSSPTPIKKEHKKENEPTSSSQSNSPTKKKSKSTPADTPPVKSSSASTTESTKEQKDKEKLERKMKKAQLMRHHSRDSEAIENLTSVAAETLKDINKWLDDTPKPAQNHGAATCSTSATPSKSKSLKGEDPRVGSSGSGSKEKKVKKLLSSTGGQKRTLDLSAGKKARSTKFNMDEDDEYNIDRDLSPPPPKVSKTGENSKIGTKGKQRGREKKVGEKKEVIGKGKEKGLKHHHKHHHHHHHHPKKEETSGEAPPKSSKVMEKKSTGSSASSVSSMTTSTSSTAQQKKGKGTKKGESGSVKKVKRRPTGSGTGTSFLNTLKNSPAFKRMNQMSRKNSSTGEPQNKSQIGLNNQGNSQGSSSAFDALLSNLGVTSGTGGNGNGVIDGALTTEKKKCLLVNDLPVNKEGISLGSVLLSTDAIKLKTMGEDERLSDEDELDRKARIEEVTKAEKEETEDGKRDEHPEEEKEEDFEGSRKLELQQKGFNREKCMPNLSAWIKAFGGPAKSGASSPMASGGTTTLSTSSPLVSPVKKSDPDGFKTKFRVMGRGVGEAEGGIKSHPTKGSHQQLPPSPHHHPSVIKTAALSSPSPSGLPVGPSWNPVTSLPHTSPPSIPLLNPNKQATLERPSQNVGEDLSSPPAASSHPAKKYRNRKMSSSSLSSQSESGSPLCVTSSGHEGGSTVIGNFPPVVNPPRWVDDHPWGPVSQSQSPSASSHVSSQSPAGPNSPFSPSVSSPPPTAPQTPPRHHPVRPPGFYQDMSQHSSPDKVNDSSPPTPNSVSGSHIISAGTSSSRRSRDLRYVGNTVAAGSKQSGGLPSPSTPPSAGGAASEPLSPNSPKVVNMSSANSSSGPTDHRSPISGSNTPAHQHSSRGTPTSVLHSTSSPYSAHHFAASTGSHQLPDPAHSHVHSLSHLGQPPQAHAGSNQYHESSSSRFYPPTVPHAHQQSVASTSSASLSSSSASYSVGGDSSGQNLAHAHSRQSTSQAHLSHPSYPSSPYASNPRNINIAPNVYNNPVDPSMNRYYKAAMAAASAGGNVGELSLSIGSSPSSVSSASTTTSSKRHSRSNASANAGSPSPHPETQMPRSASVNPAAAVAAALEAGKLAPNGFHWPHNLASLTQIVNSIPGAYRHYAAQQVESNAYPVTTSAGSGGGGQKSSSQPHHHQSDNSIQSHHHHQHPEASHGSSSSTSSKKQKSAGSSEAKSRSQSNTSAKSSSVVPGSAFNFSLAPDSLSLYSKEMTDAAASSIYSSPPMAHFPHHSSFSAAAGARTQQDSNSYPVTATPPISPYPFIPGTPYQAHQSGQPFAAHSQSSRGLDPYQQLPFLLSHPSGYPAPYAHPHSSLGFNRPGWI